MALLPPVMSRYSFLTCALFLVTLPHGDAISINKKTSISENQNVCLSKKCKQSASDILNTIDESIDPCEDFYRFSCGNFLNNTVIPEEKEKITQFEKVREQIYEQLHTIMEEPIQFNESRPFTLLKKHYKLCMDTDAIEKNGFNNTKKILKELGGWPIVEGLDWNETEFDWKELAYKFQTIGYDNTGFLQLYIGSRKNTIVIDEGRLLLKKEFLEEGFNSSFIQSFYKFSIDYAIAHGADLELAKKEMKDVIEFQIQFAKILLSSADRRNLTAITNLMRISDLQRFFSKFPWLDFINKIVRHPNITITTREVVDVAVPFFIPKMEKLINQTSKRVQANYLIFKFLRSFSSVQPERIKNLEFELFKVLTGIQKPYPKWKDCVIATKKRLDVATAALYVQKYFHEEAKNQIIEIISEIKAAFVSSLKTLDWMDEDSQNDAVEKVRRMIDYVAYPRELIDNTKINDFYANFESADDYFKFYFNYLKFEKKSRKRTDWILHSGSTAVNAFYNPVENSIELPAGILQGVYFDKDRPQYLNYGGIGFIIGHEITHGFDDQGRQIDKNGYLVNWWSRKTEATFINKTECMVKQYSNLSLENSSKKVNGLKTLAENIADNGGLKVAYLAYQSWVKRNGNEATLPGLNYTPNQLFWISMGNVWCSKVRSDTVENLAATTLHSPASLRITVSMSNIKHFADDFNCPIGSNMNPLKKCSVW